MKSLGGVAQFAGQVDQPVIMIDADKVANPAGDIALGLQVALDVVPVVDFWR